MPAPTPETRRDFIVEWYRPDRRREIVRVAAIAGGVMVVAAVTIGLARSGVLSGSPAARIALGVVGAVLVVSGPIFGLVGFHSLVGSNAYLAIRGDGLFRHPGGTSPGLLIPWADVVEARVEEGVGLRVERADGSTLDAPERYQDVTPDELAARINRARQRAMLGLLRPAR